MDTKLKNHDWLITIISVIIQIIGVLIIFSVTYNPGNLQEFSEESIKQIIFVIIGLVIYFVLSRLDFSWLNNSSIILTLYGIMVGLLVYVKFFGQTIANTNRWINIAGFSFQPSEYSKLIIILLTCYIFASKKTFLIHRIKNIKFIKKIYYKIEESNYGLILMTESFLFAMPIVILINIQPALGNSIITFMLWFLTSFMILDKKKPILSLGLLLALYLLIANELFSFSLVENVIGVAAKDAGDVNYTVIFLVILGFIAFFRYFKPSIRLLFAGLIIVVIMISSTTLVWNNMLTNYQRGRIVTFFESPEAHPTTTGYQIIQSKVAIGSGMIFGKGYMAGSQSSLNVLTQAHNDFIFASYCEQFGFVGATLLLTMYLVLIIRVVMSAVRAGSDFGQFVGLSVALLLLLHIFINIGMNIGKLPVTGIPLPLMSSGGSSILVIIIALGFVQSVNSSKRPIDFADSLMLRSAKSIDE